MAILTSAQIATLQKTLAVTNNVLPRLEMLEALANINIGIRQRVQELRQQREYLAQLATAALEIERQAGGTVTVPPVSTSSGISYSPPPPTPYYAPPPPPPLMVVPAVADPFSVPPWNPTEQVSRGTARLIQPLPPDGSYRTPTPSEQQAADQYGWQLVNRAGDGFYAIKQ